MPSLEQQVGAMVRHHRERADMTQSTLAELIDLQVGSVSRIERGEIAPSFETLTKLATALDVEVRDFFGVGSVAAKEGRDDPLVRLVDRLAPLDISHLNWIDAVVAEILLKPKS